MWDILFNVLGGIGVILILLAYFLLELRKITNDQLIYPLMNLIGSILLFISLLWAFNLPSMIIEVCWMAISLYGVTRILRNKRENNS